MVKIIPEMKETFLHRGNIELGKNGMILRYYLLKKRMRNGLILCVHAERDSQ